MIASVTYGNSNISDENGNLLFYSNGCNIRDAQNNIILGSENINEGYFAGNHCPDGINIPKGITILPINDSVFYLLYERVVYKDGYGLRTDRLSFSKLIKNSLGEIHVVEKDKILLGDKILVGSNMALGRHANGKDWWIILSEVGSNKKFKFLLSENGFLLKEQEIGSNYIVYDSSSGSTLFSPDGKKMVSYNYYTDVHIFDFDRCSGELSNPIDIPIKDEADQIGATGAAISPNSRFLYLPSTQHIYQYDLWAAEIEKSRVVVAEYDGFRDSGLTTRFYQAQLGPDGKIYIGTPAARSVFHVIEHPNEKGLACEVIQHKILLKGPVTTAGLPNQPNFRLGPEKGSVCDSLEIPSWLSITSQPYTQLVCSGDSTYFDITAEGYPLTYQWEINKGNIWEQIPTDSTFSGTATTRLEISKTDISMDSWRFRCVLDTGVEKDTSKIVTLNVSPLPTIVTDVELRVNEDTIWFENRSQNFDNYRWLLGDGTMDSTSNTFMKVYDPPAYQHTYQVDLILENECSTEYYTEAIEMDVPRVTADFVIDTLKNCGDSQFAIFKHTSPNQHRIIGTREWLSEPNTFSFPIRLEYPDFPDSSRVKANYTRAWRYYNQGLIVCDKISCDTVQKDSLVFLFAMPNLSPRIRHIGGSLFGFWVGSNISANMATWTLEDGTILSEELIFDHEFPPQDSTYKIFVTLRNTCYEVMDTIEITVDSLLTSSVDIISTENSSYLIPNPIHSTAKVVLNSGHESRLEIYTISGKLKFREEQVYDGHILSLAHLSSGIYFYKFIDKQNGKITVRKFVKI